MNWSVFGKAFLCETVYAIPFFILSILPFKKQLRFPIKILILFIFIGQLLQSSLYTYLISHGKPTRVTDTVFALVSLVIYFLCVKANFWKLLFLGDFILNYFVTVRGICFFLESRLFYDPSITYYSLRDESLLLISILLLLTLPLGLKFMKNATERVFQVDSSAFWQKVWFIPFSCTLIICAYNFDLNIDTVRKFRFILTRLWLFAMTIHLLCPFGSAQCSPPAGAAGRTRGAAGHAPGDAVHTVSAAFPPHRRGTGGAPRPAPALKSHRALPAKRENGGSEDLYRTIPYDASAGHRADLV